MPDLRWPERIRALIDHGGPTIVYQPIVDLWDGRVVGYEALSRFPDGGNPQDWFDASHLTGQHIELEIQAARKAIAESLHKLPMGVYLAVNVCDEVVRNREELVAQPSSSFTSFEEHDWTHLVIEITESIRMADENYDELRAQVAHLRIRGVRLAVDDVGAGYASFRHVLLLAPDLVKLDRSIIAGLDKPEGEAQRALVATTASFAARVGVRLVVEGVETRGECQALRTLGVKYGQGYLFGKPGPLPDPPPKSIDPCEVEGAP